MIFDLFSLSSHHLIQSPILASLRPPLSSLSMVDRGRPHYLADKALNRIDPTRNIERMGEDIIVRITPRFATPKKAVGKGKDSLRYLL